MNTAKHTQANAELIVISVNSHDGLLKALHKKEAAINELCAMVNRYSEKLGLGIKVRAEDWNALSGGEIVANAEGKI